MRQRELSAGDAAPRPAARTLWLFCVGGHYGTQVDKDHLPGHVRKRHDLRKHLI